MKLILCDGDSWTAGDMVHPDLKTLDVNDSKNDNYRLPKLWPSDLGKLTNIEIKNISRAGSSNDGIVRRILDNVNDYLEQGNNPKDLFVIEYSFDDPDRVNSAIIVVLPPTIDSYPYDKSPRRAR